jgi:hypothetical protein
MQGCGGYPLDVFWHVINALIIFLIKLTMDINIWSNINYYFHLFNFCFFIYLKRDVIVISL